MALLIDGYNLLWGANIAPLDANLAHSRKGLVRLVANLVDDAERPKTTIVFDAAQAPPHRPTQSGFRGLTILFASDYDEADALIEQLIAEDAAPKRLTVVSSDHRIQRAARRRRARAVDSDVWFNQQLGRRRDHVAKLPKAEKPPTPLTQASLADWLAVLPVDPEMSLEPPRRATEPSPPRAPPSGRPRSSGPRRARELPDRGDDLNPFPPGYADDLLGDS